MPASLSSLFLSERRIARMSEQRRNNLGRRINERIGDDSEALEYAETDAERELIEWRHDTRVAMLGRLSALTA